MVTAAPDDTAWRRGEASGVDAVRQERDIAAAGQARELGGGEAADGGQARGPRRPLGHERAQQQRRGAVDERVARQQRRRADEARQIHGGVRQRRVEAVRVHHVVRFAREERVQRIERAAAAGDAPAGHERHREAMHAARGRPRRRGHDVRFVAARAQDVGEIGELRFDAAEARRVPITDEGDLHDGDASQERCHTPARGVSGVRCQTLDGKAMEKRRSFVKPRRGA